jgi:hypothetical protein
MQRQVANAKTITYQTGWCYHNQLNGLQTETPHVLPEPDSLPPGVDPAQMREQEYTRAGFLPTVDHAVACSGSLSICDSNSRTRHRVVRFES